MSFSCYLSSGTLKVQCRKTIERNRLILKVWGRGELTEQAGGNLTVNVRLPVAGRCTGHFSHRDFISELDKQESKSQASILLAL